MAKTKSKKRLKGIPTGLRFDAQQVDRINAYREEQTRIVGFEVGFSAAVRVLVEAGLERHAEGKQ